MLLLISGISIFVGLFQDGGGSHLRFPLQDVTVRTGQKKPARTTEGSVEHPGRTVGPSYVITG